jgi:hypothetical protein
VRELNLDIHPEIGTLLKTYPEVGKEIKLLQDESQVETNREKAALDEVWSRKEQEEMSKIGLEEVGPEGPDGV